MSENLHSQIKVLLTRCNNGWVATPEYNPSNQFVFESTESLARNLVKLLGQSGWVVEKPKQTTPERDDEKGHFKPKQP